MAEKFIFCSVFSKSDEDLRCLTDLLSMFTSIKVVSCLQNSSEALEQLNKKKIDLLFLDVELADFLQLIHKPTFVVGLCDRKKAKNLIKYLRQGFFDFLLCGVGKLDLFSVIGKVLNTYGICNYLLRDKSLEAGESEVLYNKTLLDKSLFTKESMFLNGKKRSDSLRISFDEILYLELIPGNIVLHFENGTTKQMQTTLKYFQKKLPKEKFQKINRNIIVNIDKVTRISNSDEIWIGTQSMKVSRSFKKPLKALLDL